MAKQKNIYIYIPNEQLRKEFIRKRIEVQRKKQLNKKVGDNNEHTD